VSARILVVDDEPDLETLLVQKFRKEIRDGAIDFLFARDGVDALELLAENPAVDMVVTDISMPRMDGLSLLAKLQEAEEKLSTIIVSAYGDMANIRTAMNRGAFDFLTKPIDFPDLEATIAKAIRHVAALREAKRRQAAAEAARAALSRYFSPNLAERLANGAGGPDGLDLGGQRREVASLFTDLAGFTALVETLPPDVLGALLNDYLAGMTDIVFAHDGTVAKIIGDALHILFGAPSEQPDHATRAVACALALDAFAESFRARWRGEGVTIGETRIGIHAGTAVVGNFGGGRFFDYSAYGDTINVAARLEAANKAIGTRLCASRAVAERAENFRGRPVGDLILRGRAEPVRAFEPLRPDQYCAPATASYLNAFALLEAGDPAAVTAFAAHLGSLPDDRLGTFHLKRLLNGAHGPRISLD
jgi:adenylate cyclase